jgi:uncharacterized protein YbaA (DUF1428 family)
MACPRRFDAWRGAAAMSISMRADRRDWGGPRSIHGHPRRPFLQPEGSSMNYVDGFVLAVPAANREAYLEQAHSAAQVFKENGALHVVECWEDDVPEGKLTSFPMAVQRKEGEAVVFAWIVWPSREVRDKGMKASMEDPRLNCNPDKLPFDGRRMIFGGFQTVVDH